MGEPAWLKQACSLVNQAAGLLYWAGSVHALLAFLIKILLCYMRRQAGPLA